ncbi:RagB/SusD family nutrient uptake outer membrane protein [Labilibaculum sp. DW002]|uniref:RagB/SusD family nutrient uptake outer membrane protein n=1 Tax=Paralabilibaculum antarcticum TaxID=2912572 RepID=A0ABT5VY23_9BACT|nr:MULTISPECIES: RagB/SusD family nutrient uptake outer membrane protein [unclassified Labilibaculum]MBI9059771.1 RagB/SusD family nutrient uptake outer membrane protein [Labilibaculum sp.]MDE5419413.1 RagB/SusD family nutrient uptake outer membrane protein [Labilibaculum sp. DW002]
MKKIYIIFSILITAMVYTSCVNDLDVKPTDPNKILAGNLGDDPAYMEQTLAKLYASFIISGQGDGDADISSSDDGFFITMRALWNLQTITTDEGINAWGDVGISDLNTQTWSAQNPFLTAVYQRLSLSVTYANDFLNVTAGNTDPAVVKYRAEARFLRAFAYYWLMDLFANPPFTIEADGVGKYFPEQIQRADLFDFIIDELKAIEPDLGEPGSSYPQADKATCWMLLAKTYLNAEVYTGTAQWDECKIYCDKVIASNAYSLAADYRQNFSADNDRQHGNNEMIFAFAEDGLNTQGNGGTTFIIQSSSDATYLPAETFHGLTSNTNWNGNRARKDLMNILVDTIAVYGNVPVPATDPLFALAPDKRIYLGQKRSIDIPSPSSSGDFGVGVYKFTAKNHDGTEAANYSPTFASTDFPVFRLADAYLMRAEALFNTDKPGEALTDINLIRERAYGDDSGNITVGDLTSDFILDERAREFYYEGQRRTDLVRFGKFTGGAYVWQWKGGTHDGTSTSSHLNIFPIPGDEISANPNIKQNDGY